MAAARAACVGIRRADTGRNGQKRSYCGGAGAARGGTACAARALWDLPRLAANDASAVVAGAGTARGSVQVGSERRLSRGSMGRPLVWCFPSRDTGVFCRAELSGSGGTPAQLELTPQSTGQYRTHHSLPHPVALHVPPLRQERTSTRDRSAPVCFDGTRRLPARVLG